MISCTQAWIVIGACVAAALAVNAYFFVLWQEFVATVAKLQKREDELADYRSGDDGGFNTFQQEQFSKLRVGAYRALGDPGLTALGDRLQPLQMLSIVSLVACAVVGAGAHAYACP
ncbi:hypothetical protein [Pseudoduganella sp. GCM10020061]|uniref:hypothetical protein n=1 Tax=Pseudoduganella sp. GCM10020061 TaxID=3317345 RepID=UPI00362C88C2